MAAACCCKCTWTPCSGFAVGAEEGIAREATDTEGTEGKLILAKDPTFAIGKNDGTAAPAETTDSAGWSHFLLFLKIQS